MYSSSKQRKLSFLFDFALGEFFLDLLLQKEQRIHLRVPEVLIIMKKKEEEETEQLCIL